MSGLGNVSGFLCQKCQSSASVKNYKGQMATRWCASEKLILLQSPSAVFERYWRLGRSLVAGGMQVLHLSFEKGDHEVYQEWMMPDQSDCHFMIKCLEL